MKVYLLIGWQRVLLVGVTVLLASCASQQLHRDGLTLVAEGRIEEGMKKLADASEAEPDNLSYRVDLLRSREQIANRLLTVANGELATGGEANAQAIYQRILGFDPDNSRARIGLEMLAMNKRHGLALAEAESLLKKGDLEAARLAVKPVLMENPKNDKAVLLSRQIEEQAAKDTMDELRLRAKFTKPVTLQFRDANLKMVFEALSRTSGINVLLDRDVKSDVKTSIFVKEVSVEDAIELILLQNQLEKKIISDNTVFIYPSTPAKLKDYQDLKVRSFHLTNADPKQILAMLKGLLKTRDIFIHEKTNSVVMRDTPDAIRLAEKMVADQDIEDPEVMLEVEVLEVSTTYLTELGIKLPNSFTLTTPDTATTLGQLRNLGSNDLLASSLSATLNLKLEDGITNVLASPRIRVRNREKAKVMIGSRVPVITNAVTPVTGGTGSVITGSVQYLDVGLKLEVEPDIHQDDQVVIKVNLDVSSIIKEVPNSQSGTLAYEVGTRNASTVLRLKDGETQILAGLISDEDRKTASKVPGLGQMPIIGRLFSSHKDDTRKTEIVLSITPRIVGRARIPDAGDLEYWSGTENSLRNSLFNVKALGSVSLSTAGVSPQQVRGRSPAQARKGIPVASPVGASANPSNNAIANPVTLSWQGPVQAKLGDTISLTLNAHSAQALGSMGMIVGYDASVLKALDIEEGGFLRQGNMLTTLTKSIDQSSGQILLDLSGTSEDGVIGTGSVATLVFEVIAAKPQTQISIGRITPSGPTGDPLGFTQPEPHAITVLQ